MPNRNVFAPIFASVFVLGFVVLMSGAVLSGCAADDEFVLFMRLEFECECELDSVPLDPELTIGLFVVQEEDVFQSACASFESQEERHLGDLPGLINASRSPRIENLPEGLKAVFQLAVWPSSQVGQECPESVEVEPMPLVLATSEEQVLRDEPEDVGMSIDCGQLAGCESAGSL